VSEFFAHGQILQNWPHGSRLHLTSPYVVPALDLRVGETCRVGMHHKDGSVHHFSPVYREVKTAGENCLHLAAEPVASRTETLVTVGFHDLGKSTEVVLTHKRFTSEEENEKHNHGWDGCFIQLGKFLV
jgi:uncharacterized protein YndB with AHSA1/START domain